MVFSSVFFLFYFFPIVLVMYFTAPKNLRNLILFISSLFFYAWGEPVYIILMLITITVGYFSGLIMDKFLYNKDIKKAKIVLILTVIIDLGILGFFKYGDFIISNINSVLNTSIPPLDLSLPIGISFYTFQTMSYTIDLFRGDTKVQKNYISFGTYVALFPQLIAGPIVRFKTVAEELDTRKENVDDFSSGIQRFILGLGKKVLLANNIGMLWDSISSMNVQTVPILTAWIGIAAYTFQIYFDFSGYSDMAIGLGRMFGFHFLENFNYPYISKSITEFWRRWHISLSTWFKEYVYIPLGGNRNGIVKQFRNIAIVWLLTGLWHGASWNFIAWGVYFGIILMIEKLFLLKFLQKAPAIICHIYTMFLVIISWALFAFDNFTQAFSYIKAMFGGYSNTVYNNETLYILTTNIIMFAILIFASTPIPKIIADKLSNIGNKTNKTNSSSVCSDGGVIFFIAKQVFLFSVLLIGIAYMVDASYNPFLYFKF